MVSFFLGKSYVVGISEQRFRVNIGTKERQTQLGLQKITEVRVSWLVLVWTVVITVGRPGHPTGSEA
jgi:hypothetical protein